MRKKVLFFIVVLLIISCALSRPGLAQNDDLVTLKVRRAEITDVLTMITEQSGVNIIPDETVKGKVTLNLKQVKLEEAFAGLKRAYGYRLSKVSDNIYLMSKKENQNIDIKIEDNKLTLHILRGDIRKVLKSISKQSEYNIIMDDSVQGQISINFKDVPLETGLSSLLQINGFTVSKSNNIYRVSKAGTKRRDNNLSVSVVDGQVSIDVEEASVVEVLRTMFNLAAKDMVLFGELRSRIDLKLNEATIDETLDILLAGTKFTYHKKGDRYYIGDENFNNPASDLFMETELITIDHIKANQVPKLLSRVTKNVEIKVVEKQNAILATGTSQALKNLNQYIAKIDQKAPQIVVDALIIEVSKNSNQNPVAKLGMNYKDEDETTLLDSSLGELAYKSVLDLPSDFYLKLESLVNSGQATVKANPNITTLNGQEASINVGMVQYYKTKKYNEDNNTEVSEYQSIDAGVDLSVTPWVGSSDEINLELDPSVSNISGAASDGPPEISERTVSTNVRVKDGETIVIGGLIQDVGSKSTSKVPILGDIPLIGGLFRSKNNNVDKRELIIYITPHILKDENQNASKSKEEMLKKAEERIKTE
ncbi:MAG: secretin and TonB N-terminal domain-containing protein [Bacillota bacterium]